MALILVRAMNKKKALNGLADIERHAKLSIIGKPRKVSLKSVHDVTKRVLKQEPTTTSIMNLRKIHPPVHVIVISEEYPEYEDLNKEFSKSKIFDGYYSSKNKSSNSKKSN